MPYEYSELAILKRIVRREFRWGTEWHPSNYVVAHTGGNLVVDIDDEIAERIVWGRYPTPLRFTNIEEDDILYEAEVRHWRQAYAARILLSQFNEEDLICPAECVPTVVAVEGRPVLAMYLLAFERMGWRETANFLDISRHTVSKYKRRLEQRLED